jgi:hypothetical protein
MSKMQLKVTNFVKKEKEVKEKKPIENEGS